MSISCVICPPENLPELWDTAATLLTPAVIRSEGRATLKSLFESARNSKAQIWLMFDKDQKKVIASGATEVNKYAAKKVLHVMLVGGARMKEWLPEYIEKLKRFAKDNGCDSIEMVGRPGWLRELVKFDFIDKKAVIMELSL